MLLKISHRLTVDLHHLERARFLNEKLRHHTHTWTNLQDRQFWTGVHSIGYRLGDIQVSQKMLTKILLGSYLLHICAQR